MIGNTSQGEQSLTTVEWAQFFGIWVPQAGPVRGLPHLDQPRHTLPRGFAARAALLRELLGSPAPATVVAEVGASDAEDAPPVTHPGPSLSALNPAPPAPTALDPAALHASTGPPVEPEPLDIAGLPGAVDSAKDSAGMEDHRWDGADWGGAGTATVKVGASTA